MQVPAFWLVSLLLLLRSSGLATAESVLEKAPAKAPTKAPADKYVDPECSVTSPHTENFFDLRPLRRVPDMTPPHKDWTAKGQDYNTNFTINVCGPVLADKAHVEGVDEAARMNVSAFYEKGGKIYSIGSVSHSPQIRGRKLVLQYENGSLCPNNDKYRKSTIMSLMCDREAWKPTIAFVGQANECAYFFEMRTSAACATVKAQALGPVAVFGIIAAVAGVVYCAGGCVYQRTVMHARGWRQIPHYGVWASAAMLLWNGMNALWTSCVEHMPLPSSFRRSRSGGYGFGPRTVSGDRVSSGLLGNNRTSSVDDENQLIDELDDEDW